MLTIIFNSIIHNEYIPKNFHTAVEIPLFKGGNKDPHHVDSYRKISLMTIISKMFESLIDMRATWWFNSQHLGDLQGAGIPGCSNIHTSFILQETAAAYRDHGHSVFIALLDTKKAFDTVWHDGLFYKLYQTGMNANLWRILYQWYRCAKSVVYYAGETTEPYSLSQGVRQGGVLSMKLYQLYVAELLLDLNKCYGCSLYGTYYGSPCYADDMGLVAMFPNVLQNMLDFTYLYSIKWRYTYNPTKSQVLIMSPKKNVTKIPFKLGESHIPMVNEAVHVGIPLAVTGQISSTSAEDRISRGRRAFWKVCNINPPQSPVSPKILSKLYWSICIPSMLYGCEVMVLNDTVMEKFDYFHRSAGRVIQRLSENSAKVMHISSLGWWSLHGYISKLKLMFLYKLFTTKCTTYRHVLINRFNDLRFVVSMKRNPSPLLDIINICVKYGLWDKILCWFDTGQPPPKKQWELYITNTIANFEYGVWRATCLLYPSTSMFVKVCPNIGLCIWWQISDNNIHLSASCRTAFHLLTKCNLLAVNTGKFDKKPYCDCLCQLCKVEPEDEKHFLWRCPSLSYHRQQLCDSIKSCLDSSLSDYFFSLNDYNKTLCILGAETYIFDKPSQIALLTSTVRNIYEMYLYRNKVLM